jgi:hypothetical protein
MMWASLWIWTEKLSVDRFVGLADFDVDCTSISTVRT